MRYYWQFPAARKGKRCPWRRVDKRPGSAFTEWRCEECSVDAYTTDKLPPKECKRALKSGL